METGRGTDYNNINEYGYKTKIEKEEVKALPLIRFEGKIIVIDHPGMATAAVKDLKNNKILGFDTETRPAFKKGNRNGVALLQLAHAKKAYLFQLKKTGLPDELAGLLADKNYIKIGAAIHDDIKALRCINNFEPDGFIDIQQYVVKYGIENKGLKKLTGIILNGRISKSQRLTNWENDDLDEAQQIYAATDAWACYAIYNKLNAQKP